MDINKYIVNLNVSIREAVKAMDAGGQGFLAVVDDKSIVKGIITDGDFRRAILNGISLENNVSEIMNKNFTFFNKGYSKKKVKECFKKARFEHIPVFDNGRLVELITADTLFHIKSFKDDLYKKIDLPVVIMAGGKGTRLDPFTKILPKPLIPIGDKAMIEVIMDEYAKYGMKNFHISINHKGKMIKAYLEDHKSDYNFKYITESKPLGTAGALKYIEDKITTQFFVSNCDIIIKDDYTNIYDFHNDGDYDFTLVASMQNHTIPYGVCEIEKGGKLIKIDEKPSYDLLVNTGMYLLNPDVLKLIPSNEFFHITHLIEKLQEKGAKIGVYPVSEKAYLDVGQWEQYNESLKHFNR